MKTTFRHARAIALLLVLAMCTDILSACTSRQADNGEATDTQPDTSGFLVAVEDEPDTVDFQCTSIHYTVAQNVFNRLVEMESDANGDIKILPSLAKSWEISDDGRVYTFHLRENVTFSNGSPLTASDVQYTFIRLLTHPNSCNRDIADFISGAEALESGRARTLEGFDVLDDLSFTITLAYPFQAFLACLSMPGASILDQETTEQAGDRFGTDPAWTIGTGSFILWKWIPEEGMLLTANPDCWQGAPRCKGLDLRFITDSKAIRRMFENGEIDVLDLDEVGNAAEFFLHGDIYQDRLYSVPRIGITYIALNETVAPLNDARVRKAMQLSLNRAILLTAVYGGRGSVENGIFPHGLYGFNPELPEIPCDPEAAKRLLIEAGYPEVFDLTVSVNSTGTYRRDQRGRIHAAAEKRKAGLLHRPLDGGFRRSGQLYLYLFRKQREFNLPKPLLFPGGCDGAGTLGAGHPGFRGAHPGIQEPGKHHCPGGCRVDSAVFPAALLCHIEKASGDSVVLERLCEKHVSGNVHRRG